MARVYVDTSFFSTYVSTRSDPKTAGWRTTSVEWWLMQRPLHEMFVSDEVIIELSSPRFPQGPDALALLADTTVLSITAEVYRWAEVMVAEKVMPGPASAGDALHVAVAAFYRMDYLLTWNVKHLANPKKRRHLATICRRLGPAVPEIVTPDLLIEDPP